MSFTFRLFVSYGILFIGTQVVYFGMKLNGNASLRNPIWIFVNGVHSIFTYGTLVTLFLMTVAIPVFFAILPGTKHETLKKAETPPLEVESDEVPKSEDLRRLETEICKDEDAEAVKVQEVEVQREKQVIESSRNRSAEEVARSALDDFL